MTRLSEKQPIILSWLTRLSRDGYQEYINRKITISADTRSDIFSSSFVETALENELIVLNKLDQYWLSNLSIPFFSRTAISTKEKIECVQHAIVFCDVLKRVQGLTSLHQIAEFSWPTVLPHADFPLVFPTALIESISSLRQIGDTIGRAIESTAPFRQAETLWEVSEQIVLLTRAQFALREIGSGFAPLLSRLIGQLADVIKIDSERFFEKQKRQPVSNPYVIANPVQGSIFVGREDVMRRLEELWGQPGQCPSVLLYGQRRMGKSSVLQNLWRLRLPCNSVLVDFNLQRLGRVRSTGEFLYALALKLYDAARKYHLIDTPEPPESDFLNEGRNPYLSLDRFLDHLGSAGRLGLSGHRFLVAVDEFELLEEQMDGGCVDAQVLSFLRAAVQTYPWLLFALAGLHRLEELRHAYWHPLFGSVTAIEVGFLSEKATRQLVTAPTPDFSLDFDAEALARIYALSHGQPYLVQLICHSLVSRFNRHLDEDFLPPLRRFGLADVDAVVSDPEFFTDGTRYFQGVLEHAQRGSDGGQMAVLDALAPALDGLLFEELVSKCPFCRDQVQSACQALLRHAVLVSDNGRYSYAVELLRRWILSRQKTG